MIHDVIDASQSQQDIEDAQDRMKKVRTIKRQATDGERWDIERFNAVQGLPWEPIPGRAGLAIRSKIVIPDGQGERQRAQQGFK